MDVKQLDALREQVARIICYHEAVANAIDTVGSLEAAYKTDDMDAVLQEIVGRSWREHLPAARKIVALSKASLRVPPARRRTTKAG